MLSTNIYLFSQEELEQKGRELLEDYGFINLSDTLKEMLALLES